MEEQFAYRTVVAEGRLAQTDFFVLRFLLPSTPRYRSIALGSAMMPERFVASAYVEWQSCDALFFRRSSLTRQTERFVRAKRMGSD